MSAIDLAIWVVLAGLANYKAAHMISQGDKIDSEGNVIQSGEDGPFEIFKKWRNFVGEKNWVGRGFHCFSCTSFWGGLIAAVLVALVTPLPWPAFLLAWGAVATISFMVFRYFG